MVTYEGVTKLLDFGIAKALGRSGRTSIGMVKGTSGYMSPEQIRGEPLDPRSDVFALGVVMHECLTGLRLFHGKTAEEGMMAALREDVQPPSKWNKEVGPELDAVVLKALQRDREKRFNTALEFARAIEKAAPGLIWHPEQLRRGGDPALRRSPRRDAPPARVGGVRRRDHRRGAGAERAGQGARHRCHPQRPARRRAPPRVAAQAVADHRAQGDDAPRGAGNDAPGRDAREQPATRRPRKAPRRPGRERCGGPRAAPAAQG